MGSVYEQITNLDIYEMAELFGAFADTHCNTCDNPNCFRHRANKNEDYYASCPIKKAGFCGFPELGCNESALNWLQSETKVDDFVVGFEYLKRLRESSNTTLKSEKDGEQE